MQVLDAGWRPKGKMLICKKTGHVFCSKLQHKMANIDWKIVVNIVQLKNYVYFWREKLDAAYIGIFFYSDPACLCLSESKPSNGHLFN